MRKKVLSGLLGLSLAVTMVAGCGQSDQQAGNVQGNSEATEKSEAAEADEEPYELTFMYYVANDARDIASVEEAFNELTMEQLNMKVDLQPMSFGTVRDQIQMILSSDDKLDVFPMNGANISSYIDAEYIVDISEYIEEYGQDIIEIVGEEDLGCLRLDGFLAGVPTMKERTRPTVVCMRTDILNETGYTAEDIQTAEDLTKVFAKVHELHPEMTAFGGSSGLTYPSLCVTSYADSIDGNNFGVLLDSGQSLTFENWYESETFVEACKLARSWYEAGYVSADMATSSDNGESLMRAGNLFSFMCPGKPNSKQEKDSMTGYDTTCILITPDLCTTSRTNVTAYAVASNSKNPAKAVEFLNWVYKTKEANDLLNWGIEGKDYVVLEDGTIDYPEGVTEENVGYHQDYGWGQPNQFNSYVWTGNSPDVYDTYQEARDNAIVSKAYGFIFDSAPVLDEISALKNVTSEYEVSICTGSVDPEQALAEFNEKLYATGLQDVIDEKQRQFDEWLAEKGE